MLKQLTLGILDLKFFFIIIIFYFYFWTIIPFYCKTFFNWGGGMLRPATAPQTKANAYVLDAIASTRQLSHPTRKTDTVSGFPLTPFSHTNATASHGCRIHKITVTG